MALKSESTPVAMKEESPAESSTSSAPPKPQRVHQDKLKKEASATPPFPPPPLLVNDQGGTDTLHANNNNDDEDTTTSSSVHPPVPLALPTLQQTTNSNTNTNTNTFTSSTITRRRTRSSTRSSHPAAPPPPPSTKTLSPIHTERGNRTYNTYAAFLKIIKKLHVRVGPQSAAAFEWVQDAPHSTAGGIVCKPCDAAQDYKGYWTRKKPVKNYNTFKFICHCKSAKHYKHSSHAHHELDKLGAKKPKQPQQQTKQNEHTGGMSSMSMSMSSQHGMRSEVGPPALVKPGVDRDQPADSPSYHSYDTQDYDALPAPPGPPMKKRKLNEEKLQWTAQQVGAWVASLGSNYQRFEKSFVNSGISGAFLDTLDMNDLAELVQSQLFRKNILFQWRQI